ncbi:MAG TPA: hypothetical protein VH208_14035 [Myxococcaceae bacterium]|nr:hypothetical protein [Myxococcaceae bacterium]
MELPPLESRRSLKDLVRWAREHWATRSLMVSSAATVVDIAVLLTCVEGFHLPNPV